LAIITVAALALGLFGLSLDSPATAASGFAGSHFDAHDGALDTSAGTLTVTRVADKPSGIQDDTYAGDGAAEPALCPSVDLTHAAPQKSDITNFYYGTDTDAPGVLYLAWDRKFAGGTLAIDFEFNQGKLRCGNDVNPVRTDGDIMVIYEFDGGTNSTVEVRIWKNGAWGAPLTGAPLLDKDSSISQPGQLFGELAIDLTADAFKILDPTKCDAFALGWAKSRTGNSFDTSKVKDFVAPTQVNVSACGKLTIVKDARPDSAQDFAFSGTGSGTYSADVPASFSLDDDADATLSNSKTITAHPQTVTITEGTLGGWSLDDLTCTGTGSAGVTKDKTNRSVSVALKAADDITCTFVNVQPNTLTIVKDARPDNGRDFGFTATGTGTTSPFTLDDDGPTGSATSNSQVFSNLAAGTYTVSEDVAPGWTLSSASCTGATATLAGRTLTITLTNGQSPTCTFVNDKITPTIVTTKTATPTSVPEPGANVRFDVSVKNTSPLSVTITDLDDDTYGDLTTLPAPVGGTQCATGAVLAPTATYSCSFVAAVTGNAGSSHTDIVTAQGTDSDGVHVQDDDDAVVTVTDVLPEIAVTKTPSATLVHKGDTVTYTYVVTNKGVEEVTLAKSDDKCSPITGPAAGEDADADGKLDVTETWTLKCSMALTATTTNVITATGTDDEGNTSTKTATATVTVLDPAIHVTKQASAGTVHDGDPVTYTYNVTNTGTATPLTNVTISDDKCGSITGPTGDTAPLGTLSTGETWVYTCVMPLTTTTKNVVTVTGTDALGKVVSNKADATVGVITPKIDITKSASAATVHAGDSVTYTYVVTNPGNAELSSVKVVDDKCASVTGPAAGGDADGDGKLDVGETWTYTCTSTLAATTTNVATATGVDPLDKTVSDTATATVAVITPAIAITKTPSLRSVDPGTTVIYTYTVTNPGNVALSKVTVSDDKCSPVTFVTGDANQDGLLQPTETWLFRCSQVQTGAVDTLTNVGTATGTDPLNKVVTSKDTVTIAVVAPLVLQQPAPAPAVEAVIVTLPRTGMDVRGWVEFAGSLMLLGVALLLTSRRRRTA
jgi:uncharacterized repeat protein (TIGR01451 family)